MLNTTPPAPVAWHHKSGAGSVSAASGKSSGGTMMGTGVSSADRNTPLAVASAGLTIGGWGAEDTDDERSEVVQMT